MMTVREAILFHHFENAVREAILFHHYKNATTRITVVCPTPPSPPPPL